jgi:AcrR family transcriptional regulator
VARYRITIRYPSGEVEYRYGDRLPEVGERLGRAGTVSAVKLEGGSSAFVTVQREGAARNDVVPRTTTLHVDVPPSPSARDRILEAAYDLFSQRGVHDVSTDDVIEHAGVSRATLYRHFDSKATLVQEFLALREQRWTREWVEANARAQGTTPEEQLLAIFDVFDGWFRRPDFEGCAFINVLLETPDDDALQAASKKYLANIRAIVRTLAEEADLRDSEAFAHSLHVLMKGSIVAAREGDKEAAQRAKSIARLLLEDHRQEGPGAGELRSPLPGPPALEPSPA